MDAYHVLAVAAWLTALALTAWGIWREWPR